MTYKEARDQAMIDNRSGDDFEYIAELMVKSRESRIAELESELQTMQPFVESLEMKVIRMEKEKAVYRQALEEISGYNNILVSISAINHVQGIAEQALNLKDNE